MYTKVINQHDHEQKVSIGVLVQTLYALSHGQVLMHMKSSS
jgi:hypothetical protein